MTNHQLKINASNQFFRHFHYFKQVCCILSQPTLKRKECLLERKQITLRLKGFGEWGIKRLTPGTFNVLRLQFITKNNFLFIPLYHFFKNKSAPEVYKLSEIHLTLLKMQAEESYEHKSVYNLPLKKNISFV